MAAVIPIRPRSVAEKPSPQIAQSASRSIRVYTIWLLMLLAVLSAGAELAARFAFPKISRIRRRIESERLAAVQLKGEPQRPAILVVGNSLVERGVDFPSLQEQMSGYKVARFVVSDTSYYDWYYGLRRLFAEGARPQVVVAGLSARQLLANRIEGSLSANVLIRGSDIGQVARDLHKNNTELSNLYFDHLSAYYGAGTQFRKWLLATELMPDLQALSVPFGHAIQPLPPASEIVAVITPRLRAISEVCRENGARFVLVVPPAPDPSEAQFASLEQAGLQAGAEVLAPADNEAFPADLFADGLHLNSIGEGKFTRLLASSLKQRLSDGMRARLF